MHKLGITDASFLYMESPSNPMNIGSVQLLDVPQRDGFFNELKLYLADRVRAIPFMCKRLKSTPFTLDQPVWVDDRRLRSTTTSRVSCSARRARGCSSKRWSRGCTKRRCRATGRCGRSTTSKVSRPVRSRGSASTTTRASTVWPVRASSTSCSRAMPQTDPPVGRRLRRRARARRARPRIRRGALVVRSGFQLDVAHRCAA